MHYQDRDYHCGKEYFLKLMLRKFFFSYVFNSCDKEYQNNVKYVYAFEIVIMLENKCVNNKMVIILFYFKKLTLQ